MDWLGPGLGWEGSSGTPLGLSQILCLPRLQGTHLAPVGRSELREGQRQLLDGMHLGK